MTSVRVTVGTRAFPSIKEAAKALNVSYNTVEYHLNRGTLDQLAGRDEFSPRILPKAKPITVLGQTFPSQIAMVRHFKLPDRSRVPELLREGTLEEYIKSIVAGTYKRRAKNWGHAVTIRGVKYKSLAEASRALGLAQSTIWRAREKNRLNQLRGKK